MKMTEYRRTRCPYCNGTKHKVVDSFIQGTIRVRYHQCTCGERFRTQEDNVSTKVKK